MQPCGGRGTVLCGTGGTVGRSSAGGRRRVRCTPRAGDAALASPSNTADHTVRATRGGANERSLAHVGGSPAGVEPPTPVGAAGGRLGVVLAREAVEHTLRLRRLRVLRAVLCVCTRSCRPFCCGALGSVRSSRIPRRSHQTLSADSGASADVANGSPVPLRSGEAERRPQGRQSGAGWRWQRPGEVHHRSPGVLECERLGGEGRRAAAHRRGRGVSGVMGATTRRRCSAVAPVCAPARAPTRAGAAPSPAAPGWRLRGCRPTPCRYGERRTPPR